MATNSVTLSYVSPEWVEVEDGDLSRWEYLTQKYDRDDWFDDDKIQQQRQQQSCAGVFDRMFNSGSNSTIRQADHYTSDLSKVLVTPSSSACTLSFESVEQSHGDDTARINALYPGYLPTLSKQNHCDSLEPTPLRTNTMVNLSDVVSMQRYNTGTVPFNDETMVELEPIPLFFPKVGTHSTSFLSSQLLTFGVTPLNYIALSQSSDIDSRGQSQFDRNTMAHTSNNEIPAKQLNAGTRSIDNAGPIVKSPVDMKKMCLPMTAYNYFYRNERDNIVKNMKHPGDPLPFPDYDFSSHKKEQLLHQHWFVDPVKGKRKHQTTHGRIAFRTLAKEIAKRWKNLSASGRAFFQEVAQADQEKYDQFLPPEVRQRKRTDPESIRDNGGIEDSVAEDVACFFG